MPSEPPLTKIDQVPGLPRVSPQRKPPSDFQWSPKSKTRQKTTTTQLSEATLKNPRLGLRNGSTRMLPSQLWHLSHTCLCGQSLSGLPSLLAPSKGPEPLSRQRVSRGHPPPTHQIWLCLPWEPAHLFSLPAEPGHWDSPGSICPTNES